jgi:hypothetical protein
MTWADDYLSDHPAPRTKFAEVLDAVPEEYRNEVAGHATLILNTTGGMRPSDAARRAVEEFQRLGIERFRERHLADHHAALASCSCSACRSDLARRESR